MAMESGVEENVMEYVQMVSPPSVRRVKTFTWEEVLDMSSKNCVRFWTTKDMTNLRSISTVIQKNPGSQGEHSVTT